jgi:hypothetical protein
MNSRLFLNNSEFILEDDEKVKPLVIECMPFVREKLQEHVTYFKHPLFGNTSTKWPEKTDIACLHCCEYFDTQPFPSVRRYDEVTNTYFVYGIFCSLNCVKAYLIEHEPSLSTLRLLYFTHMCRNVYKIHQSIRPAPPRIRLKRFGGDLTVEEFRKFFLTNQVQRVLEPPFTQSDLTIENAPLHKQSRQNAYDILDKRETKSLYDKFLEEQGPLPSQPDENKLRQGARGAKKDTKPKDTKPPAAKKQKGPQPKFAEGFLQAKK